MTPARNAAIGQAVLKRFEGVKPGYTATTIRGRQYYTGIIKFPRVAAWADRPAREKVGAPRHTAEEAREHAAARIAAMRIDFAARLRNPVCVELRKQWGVPEC